MEINEKNGKYLTVNMFILLHFNMNIILYKYLSPELSGFSKDTQGKDIPGFFPNFIVSFTAPNAFNDPFECQPILEVSKSDYIRYLGSHHAYIEEEERLRRNGYKANKVSVKKSLRSLKANIRNNKNWEDLIKKRLNDVWENHKKNVRILSLSKEYDNPLMWAHYADSHKGFVVGIKSEFFSILEKGIGGNEWGLKEVEYSDDKILVNPYSDITVNSNSECVLNLMRVYYKKSMCWSYEKEVRFAGYVEGAPEHLLKAIDPIYVSEIRLGLKMKEELKRNITKFCQEKYPHIEIYDTTMMQDKYKLVFSEIGKI